MNNPNFNFQQNNDGFKTNQNSQFQQDNLNFNSNQNSQFQQDNLNFNPNQNSQFQQDNLNFNPNQNSQFQQDNLNQNPQFQQGNSNQNFQFQQDNFNINTNQNSQFQQDTINLGTKFKELSDEQKKNIKKIYRSKIDFKKQTEKIDEICFNDIYADLMMIKNYDLNSKYHGLIEMTKKYKEYINGNSNIIDELRNVVDQMKVDIAELKKFSAENDFLTPLVETVKLQCGKFNYLKRNKISKRMI
ncbi:hypothetical protein DMUE_0266 [Dictyocoela muelleri]|nr:hypothetical protein DMUE_0266 [Dictyocoela muelleri]